MSCLQKERISWIIFFRIHVCYICFEENVTWCVRNAYLSFSLFSHHQMALTYIMWKTANQEADWKVSRRGFVKRGRIVQTHNVSFSVYWLRVIRSWEKQTNDEEKMKQVCMLPTWLLSKYSKWKLLKRV